MLKNDENILLAVHGKRYYCPVEVAMDLLGGKWKAVILWYLQDRPLRFHELKKLIVPISEKVLIRELRELEQASFVTRTVHAQVPPKVEYALSELGQTLRPLLTTISNFGLGYAEQFGQVVK